MKQRRKKEYLRIRGDSGQHRRILAIGLVLGMLAFVPVAIRLYGLMVNEYDYYADLALRNQTRSTKVTANRGVIYDINMNILACSEGVEDIYFNPHELKQSGADIQKISTDIARLLELSEQWVLEQAQDMKMRYKKLATAVDEETASVIRSYINENRISGIHLEPSSKRTYPFGSLASQVIGFTNASNTGSEGVEAAYDAFLSGRAGNVITTKGNNEMDMPFSYEKYLASKDGCSVILTLDTTVQMILENCIEKAITSYDVRNGAFGMVMHVKTGQILAMATMNGYDPNQYQQIADPDENARLEQMRLEYLSYPSDSSEFLQRKEAYQQALTDARLQQWRNRCISDGYEPGSTFKVLTLAAALDSGAVDLDTSFFCSGAEQIPGRAQRLHCWRSTGHGAEKTPQALQNSCNVAFAHIGLKLGGDRFYSYIKDFGILERTGIDLLGESGGVFFDKNIITDTEKWGTASLTSASFGQTFKLTPLQLVRAIAAVVNGGNLMEPYIVSEVINADGETVLKQEPTVVRRVIREETSKTMCALLESVVAEGTAKNASVSGYSIGGKTGTSEKIDVFDENGQRVQDKIVSFVGIAPMDDPEYIVLVALDTPSRSTGIYFSGGVMAAPTVGAVMESMLPYLDVAPVQTELSTQSVIMEDLEGLTQKQVRSVLEEEGLSLLSHGDGEFATAQIPSPGQMLPGGSEVIVYFGEEIQVTEVAVPDFTGMNRQQASDLAASTGLYVLVKGNTALDMNVVVTEQSVPAESTVPKGTTISLHFADVKASD